MDVNEFLEKHIGKIVGILIGIILIFIDLKFNIIRVVEYIGIVIFLAWACNYFVKNKDVVKEKLTSFIEKW